MSFARRVLLVLVATALLGCATPYAPPSETEPRATLVVDPIGWGSTTEGLVGGSLPTLDLLIWSHPDACREGSELALSDTYLGAIPLTVSQPPIEIPANQEVVLELTQTEFSDFGFQDKAGYTFGFGTCRSRVSFAPQPGIQYELDAEFFFRKRCAISVSSGDGAAVETRPVTACFPDALDPSGRYEIGIQ